MLWLKLMVNHKYLQVAVIREDECIGCTKCINACPVDAIIGAARQMHTVIANECIGCKLCVSPCPVDCIEMVKIPMMSTEGRYQRAIKTRQRVKARQQRMQESKKTVILSDRKADIVAAIERIRLKNR
jgi:H+/Na+-translocating ferredoxin:NAD+ oxidoreductase subunit B